MSTKEAADILLRLLEVLISWPVILLCMILIIRRELPVIISKLSERITKAPGGFEFAELQQKVDNIATTIGRIEEQLHFRPSEALTPELRQRLESAFATFRSYLQKLGFNPGEGRVEVSIEPNYENAHYDAENKLIVVGESFASDSDVAFREYTHYVLTLVVKTNDHLTHTYEEIESGLADYFPCSFKNDALLGKIVAKKYDKPYLRNLDNERKFPVTTAEPFTGPQDVGEIWGAAFWEMRTLLGQETADKLLFSTWTDLGPSDIRSNEPVGFVSKLLQHALAFQSKRGATQIRAIFQRRGLPV